MDSNPDESAATTAAESVEQFSELKQDESKSAERGVEPSLYDGAAITRVPSAVSPNGGKVGRVVPERASQTHASTISGAVPEESGETTPEEKVEGESLQKLPASTTDALQPGGRGRVHQGRIRYAPCVVLKNVHKTYLVGIEGVAAIRGVSLTVKSGEFIMLLGKSGSGKTSLLNLIGTIDRPTRGDIRVCQTFIRPSTSDQELARLRLQRLGFVFQTFNLIPSMSALDNVALPMLLNGSIGRHAAYKRAAKLLTDVGMGDRKDHKPSQLSGGEQQRVTIARALSNEPDILLLDEPTGDLDSANTANVMSILSKLNVEMGVTMLMVTHDPHLRSYAHRAIHMLDGKIVRSETISQSARAKLFNGNGIGHLLSGKPTGTMHDLENPPAKEDAKVDAPLTLERCRSTNIRVPEHYATILGNANKTKY